MRTHLLLSGGHLVPHLGSLARDSGLFRHYVADRLGLGLVVAGVEYHEGTTRTLRGPVLWFDHRSCRASRRRQRKVKKAMAADALVGLAGFVAAFFAAGFFAAAFAAGFFAAGVFAAGLRVVALVVFAAVAFPPLLPASAFVALPCAVGKARRGVVRNVRVNDTRGIVERSKIVLARAGSLDAVLPRKTDSIFAKNNVEK